MQIGNFTVNDRESTPVAHTFGPRDAPGNMAIFAETGATAIGEKLYTVRWRNTPDRRNVRITFAMPVTVNETINGVTRTSVDRLAYFDGNFRFDTKLTEQERKNFVGMLANSFAASVTVVDKTLTGLESIW